MAVTTAKLMEIRKQLGEIRDNVIQANATMAEVNNNIDSLYGDLKELGIKDPSLTDEEVKQMEDEIERLYNEARSKVEKWV